MDHFASERKYFFLPVNTGYVEKNLPNDQCIKFYAARSGHGVYCAIVGNVVIPNGFGSNDVCAMISESEKWQQLAEAIVAKGARAGVQLSTTWKNYQGGKNFAPFPEKNSVFEYKKVLKDISHRDILKIFDDLRKGIELSANSGFKHIQIHAAHGYLFSLLIDEEFSPHSELALNTLQKIAKELKTENIESSLRFSFITGDNHIDQNRSNLIDEILNLSFSFFDVSFGFYNINKHLIYPSTEESLRKRFDSTVALAKRFPSKQIILSGKSKGFWHPSLPSNVHIGICRDLIANPNFLRDRNNGCTNCMKCHYFSNGEQELFCGKWSGEE